MSEPLRPSPEVVATIRELCERRLSADEFNAYVNAPMGEFEREQIHELHDWFTTRYPTPAERLDYALRAGADWAAAMPPDGRRG